VSTTTAAGGSSVPDNLTAVTDHEAASNPLYTSHVVSGIFKEEEDDDVDNNSYYNKGMESE